MMRERENKLGGDVVRRVFRYCVVGGSSGDNGPNYFNGFTSQTALYGGAAQLIRAG
jgi:hypothetical protein